MDQDLGTRLRAVRKLHKLSQRELAERTGVANATISQIESNTINPTVGMLKKILSGIPMSLSDFFNTPVSEAKIFFEASELTQVGEKGVSYLQVGSNLKNKALQMLHERYAPGATTGKHLLAHEGEECGIILKGRLEVTVGNQRKILGPGDAYYFKSNQPHSFKNTGKEECELISACTPPSF